MISYIITILAKARETCLAVFIGTLGYMNLSPDSQHGFVERIFHISEKGHIWLSIASFVLFVGSFGFVLVRNRKLIGRLLKKLAVETKQFGRPK